MERGVAVIVDKVSGSELQSSVNEYLDYRTQSRVASAWGSVRSCMELEIVDAKGWRWDTACFLGPNGILSAQMVDWNTAGESSYLISQQRGSALWKLIYDRAGLCSMPTVSWPLPHGLSDLLRVARKARDFRQEPESFLRVIEDIREELAFIGVECDEGLIRLCTLSFNWESRDGWMESEVSWLDAGVACVLSSASGSTLEVLEARGAEDASAVWLEISRCVPHPVDIVAWSQGKP